MNLIWDVFIRRSKIGFIDVFFLNFIYIGFFFVMRIFVLKKNCYWNRLLKQYIGMKVTIFVLKKLLLEHVVKNSSINVKGRGQKNHTFLDKKRAGDSRLDLLKIKYIVF